MPKQKIILDCDPGHDDAIAILLAGASEQIDLLGITVARAIKPLKKPRKTRLMWQDISV